MTDRRVTLPAVSYAVIGVVALARPQLVPALFGGSASTAAARTEVRAVYGGLPLALAAGSRAPLPSVRRTAAARFAPPR